MWEGIVFGLIGSGMGLALVLMGSKLKLGELKNVVTEKKCKIAKVAVAHYFIAPLSAVFTAFILSLEKPRRLALYMISITPPTVAASIGTMAVGGNVELSNASSVTLLCSAFFLMPAIFSLMADDILKVPYAEMVGVLVFLLICNGVGLLIQRCKCENTLPKIIKWLAISCMISALLIFIIKCDNLVKMTFYSGTGWQKHYLSSIIFMGIYICLTLLLVVGEETKDGDAIIITAIRKNPGITLSVAALSLQNLTRKEYDTAMGMLLTFSVLLDWCGIPVMLYLRRSRLGYFCWKARDTPKTKENLEKIEIEV